MSLIRWKGRPMNKFLLSLLFLGNYGISHGNNFVQKDLYFLVIINDIVDTLLTEKGWSFLASPIRALCQAPVAFFSDSNFVGCIKSIHLNFSKFANFQVNCSENFLVTVFATVSNDIFQLSRELSISCPIPLHPPPARTAGNSGSPSNASSHT